MPAVDHDLPRGAQHLHATVILLHRLQLVVEATSVALGALVPGLQLHVTTEPVTALELLGPNDVLIAEQRLVPSGLHWHRPSTDESAPYYIALGEPDTLGDEVTTALAALRDGALAWVPGGASPVVLLQALSAVMRNQLWLPAEVLTAVIERYVDQLRQAPSALGLTDRERTVLELIEVGRTTQEIASLLFLSPNTVRTHRQRLFAKLGVHSAVEAAAWLRRRDGRGPSAAPPAL